MINEDNTINLSENLCAFNEATLNFLKSYSINKRILKLNKYEKDYFSFDKEEPLDLPICDEAVLRAKMFEVKRFVLSLGNCNEKLILYYHYIKEESIEHCAELIGISRRSGFRLKSRAIIYAGKKFAEYEKNKKC